ncbi:bifunctional glutamate N-acetyltransferase/amino-acid acetyltransferase ArgJ [Kocuria coralli]|uniref:Arginine biosynthesis bifunctional protein ArgJ n=1 Tax=Kocuria coralli TaxID=1461025 RepID=A0A5J5KV55_9MICC|nr:bifunctional glutamate N-acetyltransferase/amino-acid acetyltransferase ArgJ [Kocuria coralli]KAA9393533.1 bifunctional glutamate N-acetyltransferase/amino-acid acetyltransferase ArgJ [Kocuria coralli]
MTASAHPSQHPGQGFAVDTGRGVTAAAGFRAAGVTAGFKPSGKPDLALVVNDGPQASVGAVFTSNRVAAAPVHWSRQVVADGAARAVILNSGGANACTGAQGFQTSHTTAEMVGEALEIGAGDVVVCSTGLIGEQLPLDTIRDGIAPVVSALGAGEDAGLAAATAIMTTDTVPKQASYTSPEGWSLGGMAKGAGMLAPGLATMLVVITTDAVSDAGLLRQCLIEACSRTFDRADSDGCMSTNDTVVLMGSGASGISPDEPEFVQALTAVCHSLAQQLIRDAEGAAHDITITTCNAVSEADAEEVSRAVARSNLFKTAVYGNDPNWGRVLSAVGTTQAVFDPDELDVTINGVTVCRDGMIGDPRDGVDLSAGREIEVLIDLKVGEHEATIWTNDLTHDYVEENSAYST